MYCINVNKLFNLFVIQIFGFLYQFGILNLKNVEKIEIIWKCRKKL